MFIFSNSLNKSMPGMLIRNAKSVAIKRIHKAFEDVIDAKRVLREIKILSKF